MINKIGFENLRRKYGLENIPLNLIRQVDNNVLKLLTKEEKERLVIKIADYWQKKGFPYYNYTEKQTEHQYRQLIEFDPNTLLCGKDNNEIQQANLGLGPVNTYHRHRYEVQCRDFKTPMDNFKDKDRLRKLLVKAISFSGNPMKRNYFISMLRVYNGTAIASNFRPTAAKFIYQNYCPSGGKVLDPSLGFSGRLMGAITSHIGHYEGCDPCTKTYEGGLQFMEVIRKIDAKGNKLAKFMGMNTRRLPEVKLHNIPFEEYRGPDSFFDLVFTSPPYFSIEKYSDEETQSWKRYKEYGDWVNGFLIPFIETSHRVLKDGGHFIVNIAGKVGKNNLEKDTIEQAEKRFGKLVDTKYLRLSKILGTKFLGKGRNNRQDCKVEPIFIFQKGKK